MTKNLQELPVDLISKINLEALKDSLKEYITEDLVSSGTFDQAKVEQKIIKALPALDKIMLGVRFPVFKEDVERYAKSMKSVKNKKEFSSAVAQEVRSSLNFLLASE